MSLALVALLLGTPALAQAGSEPSAQLTHPSWLGVMTEDRDDEVWVLTQVPESPADQAGIVGDDVLVAVAGQPVSSLATLKAAIARHPPGSSVEVTIRREAVEIVLPVVLIARPTGPPRLTELLVGQPAPAIHAAIGNIPGPVQPVLLHDRVVLLDFWATWCGPCRVTTPELNKLHARFSTDDLLILAITDEDPATVARHRSDKTYTVALDTEGKTKAAYMVAALPTFVLIGLDGRVDTVSTGAGGAMGLESRITELLASR